MGPVTSASQPGYFNAFGDLYQRQNVPTLRQNKATGAFELVTPTPSVEVLRGGVLYNGQIHGTAYASATGQELSRLDGTPIRDLNPGVEPGILLQPIVFNGLLYFTGNDGTTGFELWQSDGSASGTRLISDLLPGTRGSYPLDLTVFRGELYFDTWDGTLYKLNPEPTPTGTLALSEPSYDCSSGLLTMQTTGGNGSVIEYRAAGLRDWSTSASFTVPAWQRTGTTFTLDARQDGQAISRSFTSGCGGGRLTGLDREWPMDVFLYPNPVGERFTVGVTGAAGQAVQFEITNLNGRSLVKQSSQVDADGHTEQLTMPTDAAAGLYLLKVSAGAQTKTLKVVKQ